VCVSSVPGCRRARWPMSRRAADPTAAHTRHAAAAPRRPRTHLAAKAAAVDARAARHVLRQRGQ
jgi:hypothetical protein